MLLLGILGFIWFAVFASLYLESFWSNSITLMNVTLATLLAMNFFEPVAAMLDGMLPSFTYLWDYLSLWLVFTICFGILRLCTDFASRNRVKFKMPVEVAGRVLCSSAVGVVMVAFIMASFHVAPLPPAPFSGGFANSPQGASLGNGFLAFTKFTSSGSLSRSNTFDPSNTFISKYRQRRKNLDSIPDSLRTPTN